jgi:uncharacterized RDD family membrane protein YckC
MTGLPVTGEAVALELRVARLPSRTLALLIDLCVQVPLLFGALILVAWVGSDVDGALAAALMVTALVGVLVGYPVIVETLSHGRSLGKLAMGLRVVRDDGGPARFRHALVRALFLVFELWITSGAVGLIASLLSAQGKRLGDHFAGTVVVNERVTRAAAMPAPLAVPAGLEGWAATLDLSGLPDATAAQAQQLLGRWHQLAPEPRERLAAALAAEVALRVSPPPPPGVPPAAYLAAVVGERGRRAYAGALSAAPYAATPLPPQGAASGSPQSPPGYPRPAAAPASPAEDTPFRLPY